MPGVRSFKKHLRCSNVQNFGIKRIMRNIFYRYHPQKANYRKRHKDSLCFFQEKIKRRNKPARFCKQVSRQREEQRHLIKIYYALCYIQYLTGIFRFVKIPAARIENDTMAKHNRYNSNGTNSIYLVIMFPIRWYYGSFLNHFYSLIIFNSPTSTLPHHCGFHIMPWLNSSLEITVTDKMSRRTSMFLSAPSPPTS